MRFTLFRKKKPGERRSPQFMEGQVDYSFRRSRTITGTTSTDVRTTEASDAHLKTHRLRLHELHALRRRIMMRLAVVLALLGLSYYLLQHSVAFVNNVSYVDSPTHLPAKSAYLETIHSYVSGHPLEQFDFNLDDQNLSRYVAARHPEVQSVIMTSARDGFSIKLRKPLLVWKSDQRTFYIDGSGVSFTYDAYTSPVLSVVDDSGISASSIGAVASNQFIQFLGQLVTDVNARGVGIVTQVSIPPNTIKELDLRLSGGSYLIKTNVDRDPLQAAEDIANTIHFLAGKGITPHYIDCRVDGKAFYQ